MTTVTTTTTNMEFLRAALASGPVPVRDLQSRARSAGLLGADDQIGQHKRTRLAAERLGVERFQKGRSWYWRLPGEQSAGAPTASDLSAPADNTTGSPPTATASAPSPAPVPSPADASSDHDRDLQHLRQVWGAACSSAREVFIRDRLVERSSITCKVPGGFECVEIAAGKEQITPAEFTRRAILARLNNGSSASSTSLEGF